MKKSQAALEFLITYGWAILSVLIVISALAYFGVFNTTKYVNDICDFGDQLHCDDSVLHRNATLQFQLRNNFGIGIDITGVTVKSEYGNVICPISDVNPNTNVPPSSLLEVKCRITNNNIPLNDKKRVKAIVEFRKNGGANPLHNQTGDILIGVSQ